MFERFTDGARRVLVLAGEEARLLGHDFIGTEHLLLGLIQEGDSREALVSAGMTLDRLREEVGKAIPVSASGHLGGAPFTPRSKKVLELSLREMLARGGASIEDGDLLLGLMKEGEGVGAQALVALGVDLEALRQDVLVRLSRRGSQVADPRGNRLLQARTIPMPRRLDLNPLGFGRRFECCVLCGRDRWEVPHYISGGSVMVCQVCIEDAAQAIRDAPDDVHELVLPPRVFGSVPDPVAPAAIARAVAKTVGPEPEEGREPYLEDAELLRPYMLQAGERFQATGAVRRIRFVQEDLALIELTVHLGTGTGPGGGFPFEGPVRKIDGKWKVTRELMATMLRAANVHIPPSD